MEPYSILLAVWQEDNPDHFREAVDSMLSQSYPAVEFIIVKDGPVPACLQDVINGCLKKNASIPIVEVALEKHSGLATALMAGLSVAKTDLIARMDADDISRRERCEKQVSCFENDPTLSIVGSYVSEFEETTSESLSIRKVPLNHEAIVSFSKRRNPFNHSSVMFRKSAVDAVDGYNPAIRYNQDWDLWLRMLHHGYRAANIPEVLVDFRFNRDTLKRRKSWASLLQLIRLRYASYRRQEMTVWDFLSVSLIHLMMGIFPVGAQRAFYKYILRR
ncbi:TPA: glycosyltransferase [Streptococcus suis]